jgi:alkylresorcinol/alkylpyrone synthase
MTAFINGLGIATPPHRMSQEESLQMFCDIVCQDDKQRRLARVLFRKSAVSNRYTCVPHQVAYNWCQTVGTSIQVGTRDLATIEPVDAALTDGTSHGPTTHERMQLYAQFASELAVESSQNALDSSSTPASSITHLVTISCTGFDAPGVDIELIQRLGLPSSTQRINVGFMGCHGAINGLRTALAIVESNPQARVLMCAVELCSLHYRFQWDSEGIIGNALFADGSAALVLGQSSVAADKQLAGWHLVDTGSLVIPESKQAMSWSVGDFGFEMLLTSEVGDKIEEGLAAWLTDWLEARQVTLEQVDYWGVHPGGPRILSAVQNALKLDDADLQTSHSVLEQFGNMSSPTVLFIFKDFLTLHAQHAVDSSEPKHCLLLAFGPGLVAEVALLRLGEPTP